MRTCPRCGNRYPPEFEQCPVDGADLPPMELEDPLLGETLLGTYKVQRKLGEGGMARVYIAVNERVGRQFAVKLLARELAMDPDVVERFFREARAAAGLAHPNIVEVVDCARTDEGVPFMVMELLDGEDLGDVLDREGRLEVDRALDIVRQMAEALDSAHARGIVHRDVKPGNTFLTRSKGAQEKVKILDFGIARLAGESRLTQQGEVIGTPAYMSPEQARGDTSLDHRSDIYSLGTTLYHAVCGQPVFEGDSGLSVMIRHITEDPPRPRKLRPDLDRRHEKLIMSMLAKDPGARPQSAGEVARSLGTRLDTMRETGLSLTDTGMVAPVLVEEVRVVTVLVADLEARDTRDVETQVREANRAFGVIAQEVEKQGGRVEHLAGNRVVGLFGLSLSYGDEPARAVQAALSARERLGGGGSFRIAVGTGRTLARAGGISTGPAASAAARLIGRVRAGGIVVDASTYTRVRGTYQCVPLPSAEGTEPAYRIERRSDQAGAQVVPGIFGREAHTVGRDDELEQLLDLYRGTARSGRPQVVSIYGEAGLGKSRLRRDFVLALENATVGPYMYLEGAAQPLAREQPFYAIGEAIRRAARLEADCTEQQARVAISKMARSLGYEGDVDVLSELLAFASGLGTVQSPSLVPLREKPERLRARILDAVEGLTRAASSRMPLILCLEEGEHVDQSTVDALARVASLSEGHAVFILAVGRPEMREALEDAFTGSDAHWSMKLGPLSRSETRTLVEQLLGSRPPRSLFDAIWQRCEGVPLFVEEFLFTLRHQGVLVPDEETEDLQFVADRDMSVLPTTVEGMLQSRLDALDPELKQVIRRAAVLGTVFWDEALTALGVEQCADQLSSLVRREVVIARPESSIGGCREYAFRSVMLRDVAYQMIPGSERTTLHARAASWLASHGSTAAVLAWHHDMAGESEQAANHYLQAANHARDSYANDDALHHYDRGQHLLVSLNESLPPDASATLMEILFGKEDVLARVGRRDEALDVLEEAKNLAKRIEDASAHARATVRRGALVRLGDPREAIPVLERGLELSWAASDTEWECWALRHLAQARAFSGDLERGAEHSAQAVVVARRLESPGLLIRALIDDGTIAVIRQGHWHGLSSFQEALGIARETGDAEAEADILMRLGFLSSELGDLESARRDLDEARTLLERTGNRRVLAFTLHNLGWVLWKQGESIQARRAEEQALVIAREAHLEQVVLATEVYLALFDVGENRPAEALARARGVREKASEAGHVEPEMFALMAEALALLGTGDTGAAADASLAAVDYYEKLGGTQQFEVELHLVAASALVASGRREEAHGMRERASKALDRRSAPIEDEAARSCLLASIGQGLPPGLVSGRKSLFDS